MIFESFFAGTNDHIYKLLQTNEQKFLWIAGEKGTGKTHLLQAKVNQINHHQSKLMYLPMRELKQFSPEILDDLDQMDLICIDDIDLVLGSKIWEEKLLDLYERIQNTKTVFIASSKDSPHGGNFLIQDLLSRYSTALVLRLNVLKDKDVVKAIQLHAKIRGFDLSDDVAKFLLRRVRRDVCSLIEVIEVLDYESLAKKRKLTIPFIKSVLNIK
jgi:DnaA family protein